MPQLYVFGFPRITLTSNEPTELIVNNHMIGCIFWIYIYIYIYRWPEGGHFWPDGNRYWDEGPLWRAQGAGRVYVCFEILKLIYCMFGLILLNGWVIRLLALRFSCRIETIEIHDSPNIRRKHDDKYDERTGAPKHTTQLRRFLNAQTYHMNATWIRQNYDDCIISWHHIVFHIVFKYLA